jgi:hypothetical protein
VVALIVSGIVCVVIVEDQSINIRRFFTLVDNVNIWDDLFGVGREVGHMHLQGFSPSLIKLGFDIIDSAPWREEDVENKAIVFWIIPQRGFCSFGGLGSLSHEVDAYYGMHVVNG